FATLSPFFHGLRHEAQQFVVSAKANHVARTGITKHRVRSLEPQLRLGGVVEELEDEVADVRYVLQMLANFLWRFFVVTNRRLCDTRESRNVGGVEADKVAHFLVVERITLPKLQTVALGHRPEKGVWFVHWLHSRLERQCTS